LRSSPLKFSIIHSVMSALSVVVFISALASHCEASAFLRPHGSAKPEASPGDGALTLLSEHFEHNSTRLQEVEEELRPMYEALPKDANGELEHSTVRYALHRYFVQKQGWSVKGLDSAEDVFARGLKNPSIDLSQLALLTAKFTDLVQKEAARNLENVYTALRLSTTSHISKKEAESAFKAYLVMYLLGDSTEGVLREDLVAAERDLVDIYPAWRSVKLWAKDLDQTLAFTQAPRRNPFRGGEFSFKQSTDLVQELRHNFGSFQNMECQSLKGVLVEMEFAGTGRVPLSEFYRLGLQEDWQFNENAEYLRSLGALDESDPGHPSIFIPNYLHSQTNCLSTSSFYSVCCRNECEALLGHVEQAIAAPYAAPSRIANVVSHLDSDTVEAPRNLSTVLLSRLNAIAELHGGSVPLHGRLFAQWMHHAYPRECPFPHASGSTKAFSQLEWHESTGGEDPLATKEEMQRRLLELEAVTPQQDAYSLPWMEVEELVAPSQQAARQATSFATLRPAVLLLGLASSLFPLARAAKSTGAVTSAGKADRFLV